MTLPQAYQGCWVAAHHEFNELTRYAASKTQELTTLDSRNAVKWETQEECARWCAKHPDFQPVYIWSIP